MDKVLLNFIERSMKTIYINYAKEKGAKEDWLKQLESLDWRTVIKVVSICFGEPELPNDRKTDNNQH